MSIDMAQFHQVFFEESFEGLEVMETGLMDLEPGGADMEVINSIFRAAHSIKGGSGTFGFKQISDFTHVMETLLDEMRDGKRDVTEDNSNILLQSVDCLREMLEAAQNGEDPDQERVAEHKKMLDDEMAGGASSTPDTAEHDTAAPSVSETKGAGWKIHFAPSPELFRSGNDPMPLLRELAELGELDVKLNEANLPQWDALDAEDCYLHWDMELHGEVEQAAVEEIFSWVEDLCELRIEPLAVADEAVQTTAATEADQSANLPVVTDRRRGDRRKVEKDDRRSSDRRSNSAAASSIRVDTQKIDALINMVGELVITQSMLGMLGEAIEDNHAVTTEQIEKMRAGLTQLERNTRELQENVMQVRMMPISFTFSRFPRLVRDLSTKLGKKIELQMSGENTEVDKTVIEKIGDPLVHLVRNSLDHGIEMPDDRAEAGKPETGTIELNAFHRGGSIIIEIKDDGKGMDRDKLFDKAAERGLISADEVLSDQQVFELIFMPGFSTADVVSDVSGRGVGMDVVRRNIQELGGGVEIHSELGVGTTMTIRLPLTLAILDGQTITVGEENYIIPIISIVESISIRPEMLHFLGGTGRTFKLRDEYIPIIPLHQIFATEQQARPIEEGLLVVVESEGTQVGLVVDELLGQQQVVIKSLEQNFKRIEGFSGATILGDGSVALILDIPGIIRLNKSLKKADVKAVA